MATKDELGKYGEHLAAQHLEALGYTILDRNWRCPQGELDIVALDAGEFVFAEVKTRSSLLYGHPIAAVTPQKLGRLRRLSASWCTLHPGQHNRTRIDVIGILLPRSGPTEIDHLRRVF